MCNVHLHMVSQSILLSYFVPKFIQKSLNVSNQIMYTYSKTHTLNIGGNIYYCMDKTKINASILLYCSNIYMQKRNMSKRETIKNLLLVINQLIEKLETPIN